MARKGGRKSLHSYRVDGENIGVIYVFAVLQISSREEYLTSFDAFAKARNTKQNSGRKIQTELELNATPN